MGYPPITGDGGGGGGTGNATSIQGVGVSSATPTARQSFYYDDDTSMWVPDNYAGVGVGVTTSSADITLGNQNNMYYRRRGSTVLNWNLPASADLFDGWKTTIVNDSTTVFNIRTQGSDTLGTGQSVFTLQARQRLVVILMGTNFEILNFGAAENGIIYQLETVANNTYTIIVRSPFNGAITRTTTVCRSGTATARFAIDGTDVGTAANAVSTTENTITHSTANNLFANQDLTMTITSASICVGLAVSMQLL